MPRKHLAALIALFVVTRIPLAMFAASPELYDHGNIVTSSDVNLYEVWATALVDDNQGAYSQIRIEYPPGALPFILGPQVVKGDSTYLVAFVVMMIGIDIAGLLGLILIGRRWGSHAGATIWILALAALGPIVYLRLDLVPAVATIWTLERVSARDWMGAGGWLGVGAIAKLYPLLFVPAGVILAGQRRRFVAATAVVFLAPLLPLVPVLGDVTSSVLGYHADRGIQVESLWGGILFIAQRMGGDAGVGFSFGALHFQGATADTVRTMTPFFSIAALAVGTAVAFRLRDRRDPPKAYAESCFVILALSLALGTVFSPQFLVWLYAIGGAVCCIRDSVVRRFVYVLIPLAVITHAIFPFLYNRLLGNETLPVTLLWVRNVGILGIGIWSAILLWTRYRETLSGPSTPEPSSP